MDIPTKLLLSLRVEIHPALLRERIASLTNSVPNSTLRVHDNAKRLDSLLGKNIRLEPKFNDLLRFLELSWNFNCNISNEMLPDKTQEFGHQ